MRRPTRLLILAAAAILAACSVGPDFVRPSPKLPPHWSPQARRPSQAAPGARRPSEELRREGVGQVSEAPAALAAWWRAFGDPELDALIARGIDANLDLRAAVLAIDASRTERAIAAAGGWPSLSAAGSYSRQRLSETTATGSLFSAIGSSRLPAGSKGFSNPYNQFGASADAAWELDLFGRVRRAVEAADANVDVSIEDRRAVLVAVLADIAQSYVDLRGAQQRERVLRQSLATVEELLELARLRRAAGLTTEVDVVNAAALASATRAALPTAELRITEDVHALGRLLDREPEALRGELSRAVPVPDVPPVVPIGLPADLARRRPDIRAAEAALHAATARIGVAVASLFPRLRLGASGGFQAANGGSLLDWASRFGTIGASLDLPVFDRGRWQAVRLQDVRARQAALAYQRTVLDALHEVENALAAYRSDQERSRWLRDAVSRNRIALGLARDRYESGLQDFIDVLDAQRTLEQNELALTEAETAISVDLIRLYRSLGGGWRT